MEIVTKVMEKSWKSHGNLLVKMCTNPVYNIYSLTFNFSYFFLFVIEADIFSGIPRVTGIPRDGRQNRYESRDWDGRGNFFIGSGDREW